MRHSNRFWAVVVGAVGFALLTAVVGIASVVRGGDLPVPRVTPAATPIQYSKQVNADGRTIYTRQAAPPTPAAILSRVLERLRSRRIVSGVVTGAPAGFRPTEDPSIPAPSYFNGGKWAHILVHGSSATPVGTTRPIWEANLAVGALRDEFHANGLARLISSQVSVELPDGRVLRDIGGGVGNVVFGQTFATDATPTIEARIRDAAADEGLHVDSIDVLTPMDPAPAVVVTTTDPKKFGAAVEAVLAHLFGPPGTYEGVYLEAHDSSGETIFLTGRAYRAAVFQQWWNPKVYPELSQGPPPRPAQP
jgi:hypothetical protein